MSSIEKNNIDLVIARKMRYFRADEFLCKCGCGGGFEQMDYGFLEQLGHLREVAGIPVVISSAYRCPAHNAAVGGSPNSQHLQGMAVDILVPGYREYTVLVWAAGQAGIQCFGYAVEFLHIDGRTDKFRYWEY